MHRLIGYTATALFVATVFAANWLIAHLGIIPVGFGYMAPAAVLVVGVAFTLRDIIHRTLGPLPVLGAIIVGAALSFLVDPAFAVASGTAFLVSELADLAVYQQIAKRSWLGGVAASNAVGMTVDSVVFLWLAFGSLAFLPGQMLGKAYMTLAALALLAVADRRTRREVIQHAA